MKKEDANEINMKKENNMKKMELQEGKTRTESKIKKEYKNENKRQK